MAIRKTIYIFAVIFQEKIEGLSEAENQRTCNAMVKINIINILPLIEGVMVVMLFSECGNLS